MSPHSYVPRPPVLYRTHTPWWQRLARRAAVTIAVLGGVALLVVGTAALIARLHASEAALERAHAQGMAAGMSICGGRP